MAILDWDDRPTASDLAAEARDDYPTLPPTPCPHGCGARFHGESPAYHLHLSARVDGACPDPWVG
jgi:hypothetical protein